jgi:hypothetical protein
LSSTPYLSVVATARNDDHGGNPLYRTQLFINGLVEQSDRFKVRTELVLVEWNPSTDRPRLTEALEWPRGKGHCTIRVIEVPHELHSQLEYSDRLPLFQMIGKNVGIRRARGEFVLATNIDILLSNELMRYIAARRLRRGHVYTTDRYDVPAELDPEWSIDRQLDFARHHAIRIHRREGTLDLRDGIFYRVYPEVSIRAWIRNSPAGVWLVRSSVAHRTGLSWLVLAQSAPHFDIADRLQRSRFGGVLGSARAAHARRSILTLRRLLFRLVFRLYAFAYWLVAGFNDPRQVPRRILRLLRRIDEAVIGDASSTTGDGSRRRFGSRALDILLLPFKLISGFLRLLRLRWNETGLSARDEIARVRLHTNASGDFTLMSKQDWLKTGGYPEYEMYSMHIDGLLLYIAHYSNIFERFLPFPIYHIEHGGGFRPEAKGEDSLGATLEQRTIPQITNLELMAFIRTMYNERAPIQHNGESWGFASARLVEATPQHKETRIRVKAGKGDE